MFHSTPPIKTNINNNELGTSGAMPLKDNMADGANTFSLYRHRLTKSPAFYTETSKTQNRKKWYGNSANRSSSLILDKRNNEEVGLVSKNVDSNRMSFTSHTNRNDVSQAISRVRGGGYVVPAKVRTRFNQTSVVAADVTETADYYTPQPFSSILKSTYTAALPSTQATSFTTLKRYMIKHNTTSNYLSIDGSFNLVLTSGFSKYSDVLPKVLEAVLDPSTNLTSSSFRIDSDLDYLYSLDCSSSTSLLKFSNNWGQAANTSSGFIRLDFSNNNLIVKGRQICDTSYNHYTDSGFNATGYYVSYDSASSRFKLTQLQASAASFTLFISPIQADMPIDFNPFGIPYVPNGRVSIKKYVGPKSVIGNPPTSVGAKITISSMDTSVRSSVMPIYSGQVDVSGWSVNTDISASSMLDTIFSTVATEGNSLRYEKSVYKAFRTAALKTTLGCNSIADGKLGQNTVPYVFFTNDVSNGVHHPFMVMASYSIADKPNRLVDVKRPPADGDNYATDDVTRDVTLQNYLVKIPMLDYGEVTGIGINDMKKTLFSDAKAPDKVGVNTETPYNSASISAIGIAVDGVVIYPMSNNTLHPAQAQAEITNTGIHIGRGMGLHYHADGQSANSNNLNLYNTSDYKTTLGVSRNHPPLIGFGLDGIALYGQYDSGFPDMHGYNVVIDAFGGHEHGLYGYHYHAHTVASNNAELTAGIKSTSSGVVGTTASYNLRILMKGAWKGRINSIPEFWDLSLSAPSFTLGTNKSIYAGMK